MNLLHDELTEDRLLLIEEPHLVERYNKALAAFGLKRTELAAFHIDRSGFSPEVAHELGDLQYLDPGGVNRRFIILTPAQADLPVVHTAFSNTPDLLYEFFRGNARTIDALTIKDVIYGEIEDSVANVRDIEDLLSINQVEFRVLSAEDVLGKAAELGRLADRLRQEPHAWRDDGLLNRMVELAQITGDIRENALVPAQVIFRHHAYWTSHFGGLYVFVDPAGTTVIGEPQTPGFRRSRPWQVSYLSIHDPDAVFSFLSRTGRIELPRASWIEQSGYLEHRAEMVVRALIAEHEPALHEPGSDERGLDTGRSDRIWLQTWLQTHADLVAREGSFPFLNQAKRQLAQDGQLRTDEIAPEKRFLVVRARPDHPDAWLVNRLVTEFVPADFVSRYIFHKQGFYRDYEAADPARRLELVRVLKSSYFKDRAGFRARLYGLKD